MTDLNPELIERAAKAGFAWSAASAAQQYDLGEPVTWDRHLSDEDRAHEMRRAQAVIEAVAPQIASAAWQEGYQQAQLEAAHAIGGRCSSGNGICVQCSQGNPYEGGKP